MTDISKSIKIPYIEINGTLYPLSLLGHQVHIPELVEEPYEVAKQTGLIDKESK